MACCNDFSRTDLMRRAAAEAGRGLPAIEAGMPLPAGTGLDRRSFLARSAGLALAVYGGAALLPRALRGGDRRSRRGRPAARARLRLPRRRRRLPLDAVPDGDPLYRQLRPRLALPASAGLPFARGRPACAGTPSLAALATLHRKGRSACSPASATPARTSRTSPPGTSGRSARRATSSARAGSAATSTASARPTTRCRASRSSRASSRRSRPRRCRSPRSTAPDRYDFWTRNVWGDVDDAMLDAIGTLGALPTRGDAALVAGDGGRTPGGAAARAAAAVHAEGRRARLHGPVAYPKAEDDEFPRRLAGLAAMLGAGLPRARRRADRARHVRHPRRPAGRACERPRLTAESLLAFQRDLEARGLADRVLVHVWSEFGRRAKENGSNGTDHGAAGAGFLVGSRVNGQMIGEFPGLAKLDKDGNLRATSDFRGLYAACSSSGSAPTPRRSSPAPRSSRARRSFDDRDRAGAR